MSAIYGGDEVSAIVLDIGTHSTRVGYAGEDIPKVIVPSIYGTSTAYPDVKFFVGDDGVNIFRERLRVQNPLREGMIHDWDCIPEIIRFAICDRLRADPTDHPVLFTEPAWNNKYNRERLAEILFETYNVPATFVTNTAVCNAFAAGKGTALVVDIGQDSSSVVPVVDGYALLKGIQRQPVCPSLLTNVAYMNLTKPTAERPHAVDLTPYQLIRSKRPMGINGEPSYVLRDDRIAMCDRSWKNQMERKVVDDWWESIGGVLEHSWNEQAADSRGARFYEFPTGYQSMFSGKERLLPAEIYFSPGILSQIRTLPAPPQSERYPSNGRVIPLPEAIPLPNLIGRSLETQDIDIRQQMLGNVVLTGGGSLPTGFPERLTYEMAALTHNRNFRLHSPGSQYERRFGSWIGGSILASLGTFHQLWISREEWNEFGPDILAQRCK